MRVLTVTLSNHSIVNIAVNDPNTVTFTGLRPVKETAVRAVVVVYTPTGPLIYEVLETVDQIYEMLTFNPRSSPTDADINRRVDLLLEAMPTTICGPVLPHHFAAKGHAHYVAVAEMVAVKGGEILVRRWQEVDRPEFDRAVRAEAIGQLLRERAK